MSVHGRSFAVFLKDHYFSLIVILLITLLVASSYLRFMVQQDFIVAYEGDCDPTTHSCYEECEDDSCAETYFYSVIERHASEIEALCGPDVLECDAAYECQADVEICSITYCDTDEDECSNLLDT